MIELVHRYILPAAYSVLPARLDDPRATALLLAIGLQESRFEARVQATTGPRLNKWWVGGPARGFWQFEKGGGVEGVLAHPATAPALRAALRALGYTESLDAEALHGVIAHNDVLAAVCARLLLLPDPKPLPANSAGPEPAWAYYQRNWRPGAPHRATWDAFHAEAWDLVLSR